MGSLGLGSLVAGHLGAEDQFANIRAVREGMRVFFADRLRDDNTDLDHYQADRLVTTILLSEKY